MKRNQNHLRGCLVGGAIGDALGWPVEFMSMSEIRERYGRDGIMDLVCGRNGKAKITDDTQMTIFTAEGLLRHTAARRKAKPVEASTVIHRAYLRWLLTQGYFWDRKAGIAGDSWILDVPELHASRAPSNSCITALRSGRVGTVDQPINNSRGCSGVMRVVPVGLLYGKDEAFAMGRDCAALTHGHPLGYLSAGALAHLIACIVEGMEIEDAVEATIEELTKHKGHSQCSSLLRGALELAKTGKEPRRALILLGGGWSGEETLAISAYCALKFRDDFRQALITAVNHDGNSDSTGAITGNILGAYLGLSWIPGEWMEKVELAELLVELADDLLTGYAETLEWTRKYPGGRN